MFHSFFLHCESLGKSECICMFMFMFMCTCTCICSIAWAFHHVQCAEDALYVWICSVYGCACLLLCAAFPFFASCERACEKKLSTHVPKAALVFGCSANNVCELGQCSFACSKTYIEYGDGGVYTMNCHSPHDVGHFPSAKNLHTLRSLTHSLARSFAFLFFSASVCAPVQMRLFAFSLPNKCYNEPPSAVSDDTTLLLLLLVVVRTP